MILFGQRYQWGPVHVTPTVMTIVMAITLLVLCAWQFQRLEWKENLIDAIDQRANAVPLEVLPVGPTIDTHNFQRITLTGVFDHDKEVFLVRRAVNSEPGLQVLTPLTTDQGQTLLVNRGYVPFEEQDPTTRLNAQVTGRQTVTGVMVFPRQRNLFTPKDSPEENLWFVEDIPALRQQTGLDLLPYTVSADKDPRFATPRGGQHRISLRNNHLQYTLTWFGLFLACVGVYVVYNLHRID
ncbi:MAG: SURF1 family protein [Alphaproteobacteria bacterium]|nr:SURF1 family protein [Alphaproteobacteria bacterium]